ncbi:hypothetical protein GCM10009839_57440 [Catenulispora yoronensis]|uniref:Uncharacterized protein n=1 Tax=Catenulispora yoronensis TaxID=450799 RepID=A0ABP5GFW0_9ACTN
MSQYYVVGDETVWNPAQGVSQLFLRQVAAFEDIVAQPSGIGPMESDEARIAPAELRAFADALLLWRARSRHPVLAALSDGFLATIIALADRTGVADPTWDSRLVAAGSELSRSMSR